MNQLVAWFARSPVAANVLMLLVVVTALLSLGQMQRDTVPRASVNIVQVQVVYPGASAEDMESSVLRVIEERLVGLSGLSSLSASAREGLASVSVEMREGSDMSAALAEVRNRVAAITTLPQDAELPIVRLAEQTDLVAFLMLYGSDHEGGLRWWAQHIQDRLIDQGIASRVLINGIRKREIHIEISPQRLHAYGLDLSQIQQAIRSGMSDFPAGTISTLESELQIRVAADRNALDDYAAIRIGQDQQGGSLRLDQVAEIRWDYEDSPLTLRYQGRPAVQLTVLKDEEQDVLRANAALDSFLLEANGQTENAGWLPGTLRLERTFAWADLVQDRLDLLVNNGLLGLILVFAALWFFTNWRVAFWVGSGLAVALLGSLWLLHVQGATINMLSMFALIMAVGILVDDAIIVAENIYARLEQGADPRQAVVRGTQQVLMPIIGATATSAAAFLPLVTVPGRVGEFMRVLPITIVAGLVFSLIESFLILPHHLLPAMRRQHVEQRRRMRGKPPFFRPLPGFSLLATYGSSLRRSIDAALLWWIDHILRPCARYTVRWRYLVLTASIALLMIALGSIRGGIVPWTFFPSFEGDMLTASLRFPSGTAVDITRRQVELLEEGLHESIEQLLAELPEQEDLPHPLRHISSVIGSLPAHRNRDPAQGSHLAGIIVGLSPNEQRSIPASLIQERWQRVMEERRLPGLQSLRIEGMEAGPGGSAIDIRFSAPSWEALHRITAAIRQGLEELDGVRNIDDSLLVGTPELRARPNQEGTILGLDRGMLGQSLRSAVAGAEALRFQSGADEVIVRVGTPTTGTQDYRSIWQLPINLGTDIVPLASVADIEIAYPIAQIDRFNRQRVVTITADLAAGVNTDQVLAALGREGQGLRSDSLLDRLQGQEGARFLFEGVAATQATTIGGIQRGMALAVLAIYLILVLSFRSWLQPLVIIAIIPVGFIGAIAGHLLLGLELSLISLFGIVGLTGIVVNDAITFIHFVHHHHTTGRALPEAVEQAICARFRPIIMTTVTTVFGLLPLLVEGSVQAALLIPMATAISFGLIASTLGTLVVIPALYVILHDGTGIWLWLRYGCSPFHHLQAASVESPVSQRQDLNNLGMA